MFGISTSATVYTPNATDGDFTVEAQTIVCRLAYVKREPENVADDREDIGERRRLLYTTDYTMPDTAQVAIDGVRWNILSGTYGAITGPNGSVVYRRCEVEKVK